MPPPRKEPKEQVVYPSSKRKVPAFKPLKPSKVPRIPTTESESSVKSKPTTAIKPAAKKNVSKKKETYTISDSDDGEDDGPEPSKSSAFQPASKTLNPPAKRKASAMTISSNEDDDDPPPLKAAKTTITPPEDPMPTQADSTPSIPQPLLLRLLHESFADRDTKIDKHAVQVFQKYVEVFVREAIVRCALDKKDAVERGECSDMDAGWLELEDLEKAAPSLMLDF